MKDVAAATCVAESIPLFQLASRVSMMSVRILDKAKADPTSAQEAEYFGRVGKDGGGGSEYIDSEVAEGRSSTIATLLKTKYALLGLRA
jgi:hypothetical protein